MPDREPDLGPMDAAQARARIALTQDRIRRRREQLDAPGAEPGFLQRLLGTANPPPDLQGLLMEIADLEAEVAVLREFVDALPEPDPERAPVDAGALLRALPLVDGARDAFGPAHEAATAADRARRMIRGHARSHRKVAAARRHFEAQEAELRYALREITVLLDEACALLVDVAEASEVREALAEVLVALVTVDEEPVAIASSLPELERSVRGAARILHRRIGGR